MDRQRRTPRRGMMHQAIVTPADSAHSHTHSAATPSATTTMKGGTTTTTKACVECMRRKIRCNGRLPCDKCIYYEVPICQYRPRKQRKPKVVRASPAITSPAGVSAPVTTTVSASQQPTVPVSTSAAEALVARLFPGQDPAALICLPPHALLGLAKEAIPGEGEDSGEGDDDHNDRNDGRHDDHKDHADDNEGGRGWHEFRLHYYHHQDDDQEVCDDVNGLSINIHRRSYLGISSIQAIFRAMFRVKPSLQWELQRAISQRSGNANTNTSGRRTVEPPTAMTAAAAAASTTSPSSSSNSALQQQHQGAAPLEEETAINAYFAHVHGIVPLLDEVHFRDLWRRGQRCDRPWLALLNMVLVLGALAFGDERSSHIYYLRAQQYLDFELLATGCLESLQALCLLGGLYLHLRNAPNMAYTVMGMAYRIAIGLGLHRMPATSTGGVDKDNRDNNRDRGSGPWRPQVRQRIWWSLFCLDTWGAMNLGRPTLGRWEPRAMTVPRLSAPAALGDTEDAYSLSLDCASAFCLVATKIQQRLAQPAPMRTDEVLLFDAQVQSWHRSVPPALLSVEQCPPSLRAAQRILRYRYFNLRLLLLRSVLIRYAHARASPSNNNSVTTPTSLPDQQAVALCRDIACEAVEQIHLSFAYDEGDTANRILVWSAVWYLYQATMVLLLSIMVDPDHPESSTKWRASVETALVLLASATPVSRAAERSRLLVQSLLHICTAGTSGGSNPVGGGVATNEGVPVNIGTGTGMTTSPTFTFTAYPALSPNSAATMPAIQNQHGTHPGTHPGSLQAMNGITGMHGTMSDEDLWSLLGLDMFTEEASTWGANELGDWPVTDYNHGQFGA